MLSINMIKRGLVKLHSVVTVILKNSSKLLFHIDEREIMHIFHQIICLHWFYHLMHDLCPRLAWHGLSYKLIQREYKMK